MITEAKIEAQLVKYCREVGIYTRKFASPAHRGVPDRLFIRNGRVLFLELKRPGNKATALQLHEVNELRRNGVRAFVATGYDEAKTLLDVWLVNVPQDARDLI